MPEIHLPIGGSTIHRCIHCPKHLQLCKDVPERPAGDAADIGTLNHTVVLDNYLHDDIPLEKQLDLNVTYNGHVFNEDMLERLAAPAAQAFEQLLDDLEITDIWIETFVTYIKDVAGGSVDLIGLDETGTHLLMGDLKTGRVPVNPVELSQLAFYTLCLLHDPAYKETFQHVRKITFAIIQPPVSHEALTWETDMMFIEQFKYQVDDMLKNPNRIKAGAHCQYCRAAYKCPEKLGRNREQLKMNLTNANQLAAALDQVEDLKVWIKSVEEQAMEQLELGRPVGQWEIQPTRPTEQYKNEESAKKVLQKLFSLSTITKSSLITPAQLRKVAKKEGVDISDLDLTEKVSKGKKLVKSDGKVNVSASTIRAAVTAIIN